MHYTSNHKIDFLVKIHSYLAYKPTEQLFIEQQPRHHLDLHDSGTLEEQETPPSAPPVSGVLNGYSFLLKPSDKPTRSIAKKRNVLSVSAGTRLQGLL